MNILKVSKHILITLICFCFNQSLFGTAQAPDYLIYQGDTLAIFSNPLEAYFDENHPRPDSIFEKYGYHSTGCWRGYIGYWELKEDSLFLVKLEGDSVDIDLSLVFPNREVKKTLIFADWYSYSLLHPYGDLIHYEHMGYASIYEFEREFILKAGVLKEIVEYDNSKSKESIYTQKPSVLYHFFYENIDWDKLGNSENVELRKVYTVIITDSIGKINDIRIVRGINELFDNEAKRVIKKIPEWTVYYQQGKPIKKGWTIAIIFDKVWYEEKIIKPD